MTETLAFAFAAGLVAAVNPCGFALLPAYLTLVVLGEDRAALADRRVAVVRALGATAAMTIGFLAVFGAFGLLVSPLTASAGRYLPAFTVVVGVLLLALGGWLLSGRELGLLLPRPRGAAPTGLRSMVLYGAAYAVASLSCTVAPFLAVTAGTFRAGEPFAGLAAYGAYAAGMGLLVGVLAVALALAGTGVLRVLRRALPYVPRIGGALVLLAGAYVTYYGLYELRLFVFDGPARDPVVTTVLRGQQWLAALVDVIGWLPLTVALVLLVGGAFMASGRRRALR
ncbi:MAG TPA: cytochrome c biogenesis protein CcdA [Pseudonocardiaceae bacterium]